MTLRNFLNNPKNSKSLYRPFDFQIRLSWHRLQYDETKPLGGKEGIQLRNYLRESVFVMTYSARKQVSPTIFIQINSPLCGSLKISFFVMVGVGAYFGKPKSDLFHGSIAPENRYFSGRMEPLVMYLKTKQVLVM